MGGVSQMFHGMVGGRGLPDEATSSLRRKQPRALATQIAAVVACFFGVWVAKSWMATWFDLRAGAALRLPFFLFLIFIVKILRCALLTI
jgi:hypothetical protein